MNERLRRVFLFDIDGTLMRGAGLHHKQALIDGISKVTGLSTTLDGVSTAGMLDQVLIAGMLHAAGVSEDQIRNEMPEIVRECGERYRENCQQDLSSFICPMVRETLNQLQSRGAALGLVTGNLTEIGWRKIELAGLRSYFAVGAFSEDGRTRAELARIAAHRALRVEHAARSDRISLIGDHANDIEAARANGYRSIAVATGIMSYDELAIEAPDILVKHLGELDLPALF